MFWFNAVTMLDIPKNSKVAIVGSRGFNDYELLRERLKNHAGNISEIISGGAKGADSLAEMFADEYGIKKTIFKAEWSKFGRSAGIIRNKDIVKNCDVLIAFWDGKSKGTKNSIDLAISQNKKVTILKV